MMLVCDVMIFDLQLERGPLQFEGKLIIMRCESLKQNSSLQSPSDLRVSMANRDFKYFYEDEVFRVTKKGSLQFGMVRIENLMI